MTVFAAQGLGCVRAERTVFSRLDFELEAGGALRLTGPNGSGKSSLLRVMSGLLKPAAGDLTWDGDPVSDDRDAHRARLAFIGHADALKPVLTVEEGLRFWARFYGALDPEVAVDQALMGFGLERLADFPVRLLSSGQRRRLALARLLVAPTRLWLLDEPTTGLDAASVVQVEKAIREHRAGGGMVAVATHIEIAMPKAKELNLARFAADIDAGEAA